MLKSLKISNFKMFDNFEINDLSLVNLISGKNNVGKSTLLEAIFLLIAHNDIDIFSRLNNFRKSISFANASVWENLFYNFDTNSTIKISGVYNNDKFELSYNKDNAYIPLNNNIKETKSNRFEFNAKKNYSLKCKFIWKNYTETNNITVLSNRFINDIKTSEKDNEVKSICSGVYMANYDTISRDDEIFDWFSEIAKKGLKREMIDLMKIIEPNIANMMILTDYGNLRIYAKLENDNIVPIEYMGDGIRKLLCIYLLLKIKKYKIVLIDEIETGLHYSIYETLWKYIYKLAEQEKCQIVATTHSYENIAAFQSALNKNSDVSYFRLGREEDVIKAHRFSPEMLDEAISLNMEVR